MTGTGKERRDEVGSHRCFTLLDHATAVDDGVGNEIARRHLAAIAA